MNKNEFLDELSKRIDMLEDSEQQDILDEYAQHIDLRMHSGLSEEDAIKDFGDFDQLVREILGAYHVKPGFQNTPTSTIPSPRPTAERCRNVCASLGEKLKAAGIAVKEFFIRTGHRIQNWFRHVTRKAKGFFHQKSTDSVPKQHVEKPKKEHGSWLTTFRSALRRTLNWFGRACTMLLYLGWNLCLLLCAAPIILITLAMVVLIGISIMLLFQGYPLLGITLCTLGGLLFCFGLLGLGWTMIWHRPRKENTSYEEAE